jgi:hypothetical protein
MVKEEFAARFERQHVARQPEVLLQRIIEAVFEAKALSFDNWLALSPNPILRYKRKAKPQSLMVK